METKLIDPESGLMKGNYIITYKIDILPDLVWWLLDQIRPILNFVAQLTDTKNLRINSFKLETIGTETYLKMFVSIEGDSPAVPVSAVLLVLAGLLAVVMIFLTFDKIEQIIETPAGKALSFGFLVLIILGLFAFFKYQKGKT